MPHSRRFAWTTLLAGALSLALATPAGACTGVIVGKNLTQDGSTYVGRTEDLEQNHPKRVMAHPAGELKAGEDLVGESGVRWQLPADSQRYTSISDVTPEKGRFDEAGTNGSGVMVDATVSAKANDQALAKDPYEKQGWTEGVLGTALLSQATNARQGVDLLASLVDRDGMAEGDSLVIADQQETWYVELYTGHQYVAMQYPDDAYSVTPNAYWLHQADCHSEQFRCSPGAEAVARDAGVFRERDGKFDPAASYNEALAPTVTSRAWSGLKLLDPANPAAADQQAYPLLNHPSNQFRKLGLADLMALQRNRFEHVDAGLAQASRGVADDNQLQRGARYPVGNTNTMEGHIFRINGQSPSELFTALGSPQAAPYVPYFSGITGTPDEVASMSTDPKDPKSYYWTVTAIANIVARDRNLQEPVRRYLQAIEGPWVESAAADGDTFAERGDEWATQNYAERVQQSFQKLQALRASLEQNGTVPPLD